MKYLIVFFLVLLTTACTDTDYLVDSQVKYTANIVMKPYPLVTINSSQSIDLTILPDTRAELLSISGFHTMEPGVILFEQTVLDTLSEFDLIPNDNVFRLVVPTISFTESEDFTLVFAAFNGDSLVWRDSLSQIQIIRNNPPSITSITLSDTLNENPFTWLWQIEMSEEDPDDTLKVSVEANFSTGWLLLGSWKDDGLNKDLAALDQIIQAGFDSTARAGLQGETSFRFTVSDKSDNQVTETSSMWVKNSPPVILDVDFPDTLIIQEGVSSFSFYAIRVSDPETLTDVDSVSMRIYGPDGSFILLDDGFHDDGLNEDEVAGDGWYSHLFVNPNLPAAEGDWRLTVYARDRVSQKSIEQNYPLIIRNP